MLPNLKRKFNNQSYSEQKQKKVLTRVKVLLASWALWLWSGRLWETPWAFSTTEARIDFRWWNCRRRSTTTPLCSWLHERRGDLIYTLHYNCCLTDWHYKIPLCTVGPVLPCPHPLVIRVLTFSQAVFTSATSLRASPASSLSLWASWLPFSSNHRWECCRDWSSSSSWTKKRSLGGIDAEKNNGDYELHSNMIYEIFQFQPI